LQRLLCCGQGGEAPFFWGGIVVAWGATVLYHFTSLQCRSNTRTTAADSTPAHRARTAGDPYLVKLESIASSAVRAAERVGASLIVVYTTSGKTAQLVAKYRPPMPIMTLVVPNLVSDGLRWSLKVRPHPRLGRAVLGFGSTPHHTW
jgi:hypothetical protein